MKMVTFTIAAWIVIVLTKVVPTETTECEDIADCNSYGLDLCSEPPYSDWVSVNCRKYCGLCPKEPVSNGAAQMENTDLQQLPLPSACEDKADCNSYGSGVCSEPQYSDWVSVNCPKYCRLCPKACEDKADCNSYGPGVCSEQQYSDWVSVNCPKYCGLCPKDTAPSPSLAAVLQDCEDQMDCSLLDKALCTDSQFKHLMVQKCAKHCGLCLTAAPSRTETPSRECKDTIDDCENYGKRVCDEVEFQDWVNINCPAFCNKCDAPVLAEATKPDPCVDTVPDCAEYPEDLCTNLKFYHWVENHCQHFCGRCPRLN